MSLLSTSFQYRTEVLANVVRQERVVQSIWKTVWWFLMKLLPYDLAIILFGIYPVMLKTCVHTQTSTWTYLAVLVIITKLEATKMSFSRWMDKLWYIQTMEYYTAL